MVLCDSEFSDVSGGGMARLPTTHTQSVWVINYLVTWLPSWEAEPGELMGIRFIQRPCRLGMWVTHLTPYPALHVLAHLWKNDEQILENISLNGSRWI